MIGYLQKYFHPTQVREKKGTDSLAICSVRGGTCLSHNHARQFVYVMQSLALWREILHGMRAFPFLKNEFFLHVRLDHQTCSTSSRSLSRTCSQRPFRTVYVTLARV